MKTFITIVAASAVLSASLCAGLAATDAASGQRAPTAVAAPVAAVEAPARRTGWVEPPARTNAAKTDSANTNTPCREAWPYRSELCAAKDRARTAPARKVRVIPTAAPAAMAQR